MAISFCKQMNLYARKKVAERVGFEPTALDESPVFKTGSLNHSDISPTLFNQRQIE